MLTGRVYRKPPSVRDSVASHSQPLQPPQYVIGISKPNEFGKDPVRFPVAERAFLRTRGTAATGGASGYAETAQNRAGRGAVGRSGAILLELVWGRWRPDIL